MGCGSLRSQSRRHTRACTNLGVNELLNESSMRPPVLKAHSDATLETGIDNTSRAISERI